jgi:hypothetical protein
MRMGTSSAYSINDIHDDSCGAALLDLLQMLKRLDYRFVTATPASHARVLAHREGGQARDLRDALGWSMPFDKRILPPGVFSRSTGRRCAPPAQRRTLAKPISGLDAWRHVFLHSAYPTLADDAVFFGPDSYRFADLIRGELSENPPAPGALLVDIGTGSGVGAMIAANVCPDLRLLMTDINPQAIRLARINAGAADIEATYALGPYLEPVSGLVDVALANPPHIVYSAGRDYRDGGDMHGARLALDMATAATKRLAPGGRLILYIGGPIIAGDDPLRCALADLASHGGLSLRYWEIDPDVFGEELANSAYANVERIAAVGAVITSRSQ